MKIGIGVCAFVLGLAIVCVAQEESSSFSAPMEVDPSLYNTHKRPVNKEQSVEELEAYFLETIFLKNMSGMDQSLLTEEEQADSPMSVQLDVQDQMMMKALSTKLAKQDILGLKKQLLKKKKPQQPQSLDKVRR